MVETRNQPETVSLAYVAKGDVLVVEGVRCGLGINHQRTFGNNRQEDDPDFAQLSGFCNSHICSKKKYAGKRAQHDMCTILEAIVQNGDL